MKRSSSSSTSSCPPAKKRGVTVATLEKWKLENDKAVNTKTCLEYEAADRFNVAKMKCGVCRRFEDKVRGCRNFSFHIQTLTKYCISLHCFIKQFGMKFFLITLSGQISSLSGQNTFERTCCPCT